MVSTNHTGRHGEDLAVDYLRLKNFTVRERNVRFGRFELDIVAYDPQEQMIVFVEVKTRSTGDDRYPLRTAVDTRKRRALKQAISRWVLRHRYEGPARTDIICIAGGRIVDHRINIGSEFF